MCSLLSCSKICSSWRAWILCSNVVIMVVRSMIFSSYFPPRFRLGCSLLQCLLKPLRSLGSLWTSLWESWWSVMNSPLRVSSSFMWMLRRKSGSLRHYVISMKPWPSPKVSSLWTHGARLIGSLTRCVAVTIQSQPPMVTWTRILVI